MKNKNNFFYTQIKTVIGTIYLFSDGHALIGLDLSKKSNPRFKQAIKNSNLSIFLETEKQLIEYFAGSRKSFNLNLAPQGTEFQKQAWNALLKIPYGKVKSYSEQAKSINRPKAQRAIGSANGKNPILIIIPCHRIITANKKLGGYAADIKFKEKLLELEGVSLSNSKVNR